MHIAYAGFLSQGGKTHLSSGEFMCSPKMTSIFCEPFTFIISSFVWDIHVWNRPWSDRYSFVSYRRPRIGLHKAHQSLARRLHYQPPLRDLTGTRINGSNPSPFYTIIPSFIINHVMIATLYNNFTVVNFTWDLKKQTVFTYFISVFF